MVAHKPRASVSSPQPTSGRASDAWLVGAPGRACATVGFVRSDLATIGWPPDPAVMILDLLLGPLDALDDGADAVARDPNGIGRVSHAVPSSIWTGNLGHEGKRSIIAGWGCFSHRDRRRRV